jgi:hypothetical protein
MLLAMLLAMPAIGLLLLAAGAPICAHAEPAAAAAATSPSAMVNFSAVFFIFLLLLFEKTIRTMRTDASQNPVQPRFFMKKQILQCIPFVARFAEFVQFFLPSSAKKYLCTGS